MVPKRNIQGGLRWAERKRRSVRDFGAVMSKPFDATLRELFELEPAAWLEFFGMAVPDAQQVRVIDSNLSTFTAEADKVVRIDGAEPSLVHIEFLSGRDPAQPERSHWYNTLLARRHQVPVWSVIVLLRAAADGAELTGAFERQFPGRGRNLWFGYDVVRIWRESPDRLLGGGLPLLPLAPVADVAPDRLPEVLRTLAERLRDEVGGELRATLWTATAILMGLRYPRDQVEELIEGVKTMVLGIRGIEESWVYQDIFARGEAQGEAKGEAQGEAKGRVEEARDILLRQGRKKLGEPSAETLSRIAGMNDLDGLNLLLDRILDATSWAELLAPIDPAPGTHD